MSTRSALAGPLKAIHDKQLAIRLGRMVKLIDLYYDGSVALLVKGRKDQEPTLSYESYISQLRNGHRPLGEAAARSLEVACGKPVGWLDGLEDHELDMRLRASAHRTELLSKFVRDEYEGDVEKMLVGKKAIGRLKPMIDGSLKGERFISLGTAEVIEKKIGMPSGYLTGA